MNLENTVVIVASLGELKIFDVKKIENIVDNKLKVAYNLELLKGIDFIDMHKRVSEKVSDQAGNFKHGTNDDANNLLIEEKKAVIQQVAKEIEDIVKTKQPKHLFLSFEKEYFNELMEHLDAKTKDAFTKVIHKDLVNMDRNKILSYFL